MPKKTVNITEEIRERLFSLRDEKYRDFQGSLIPTAGEDSIIGVRTPELRKYAKELKKRDDIGEFLRDLPHNYFEENQLHAFIIAQIKDFDECLEALGSFLPYVDNWATCDQMNPKALAKNKPELFKAATEWIASGQTYTIRFGIKVLMDHFLDEDYDRKYPEIVVSVKSDEYYVNMMIAWYFATALAKQYEDILPFIKDLRLAPWTHNKAIQKAVESYRITPEQKEYLKSLKLKI